ncbi:MAG: GTP-binding protein [Eubacteriaceae bacterium]
MNKIILISGFLGSGKTSFIIKLIKYLSDNNIKTALIVNEVGEIGIDNQYMKQLGYDVWELFGGCICCSLSSNLENTINELNTNYKPEIVIIEPSGAAEPKMIFESLINCKIPKSNIENFLILDPTRINMLIEILSPLLNSSLDLCNTVIMNKIDIASKDEMKKCENLISERNLNSFKLNLKTKLSNELKTYINTLLKEKEVK